VVAANAAAATFFGATDSTSLLRQHIHALAPSWTALPPSDESNPSNSVKGPTRVTIRRGDGRELLAEAVITAVPSSGGEETFQAVLRDATAQETREKGLRFLVHQTTKAQEEERERIARELHDDTLQALILMAREIECLSDASEISGTTQARLGKMAELATKTGEDLRRFSRDLRPSILKDLGLVPAIEWLTADLSQRAGLKASFHVEGETRRLPGHAELALFRIAQESLRNVEKHAQATGVDIVLGFHPAQVLLNIRDNGTGFMAPSAIDELVLTGKLGLVGLKERALLVGGALEVRSAPGQGTEVAVTIPG
ncbi:MAG: sensor histidine kinase, partial [Chloroflexi bacterium]|nr:sensor histidine kinase [Chloroflexota bacterium]